MPAPLPMGSRVQILRFTDWRGVFGALAAIGLLLLIATCFLPETLPGERRSPPGLTAGAQAGSRLLKKRRVETLVVVPLVVMVGAGAVLVAAALAGHPPLGALPFLLGAVLSPLAGLGGQGNPVPTPIAIGILCLAALACQQGLTRRS